MPFSDMGVRLMRSRLGHKSGHKKEQGQILFLFEIVLIVILAFAALVIDIGFLRNNRQILVNAIDAGALAGGTVLPVQNTSLADNPVTKLKGGNDAKKLIDASVQHTYPGISYSATASPDTYQITYRCLIGADPTGKPWISRDIPTVCDPSKSLKRAPVVDDFEGAGTVRFTNCDPYKGDKCNVVYVTAVTITKFNIGPVIGVNQGSSGSVSSAACKGECGAAPVVPVDAVIILDRTMSMAGSSGGADKITSLKTAAKTVLSVYDPSQQRIALALTGPSAVNATTGEPTAASCGYGTADNNNWSPLTTLTTSGNTNLFRGAFANTILGTAMTKTSPATISVTSTAAFPATGNFTVQIDSEQIQVKVASATSLTVVTRGYNSTTTATHAINAVVGWGVSKTDTTLRVASAAGFPTSGSFNIIVDSEQMQVTSGPGTATPTVWTVTRGINSTTTALHGGNEPVSLIYSTTASSIVVNSSSGFPATPFTIQVDSEHMLVTGISGTTWTVTRGVDSTTKATHTGGVAVTRIVGVGDTSIQVNAPTGVAFPSVPYMIAVGSSWEHMWVTSVVAGTPATWTVQRAKDGTAAATHANGQSVYGTAPWVPSAKTVGMWVPVGLSGTDTDLPLPDPTGPAGDYKTARRRQQRHSTRRSTASPPPQTARTLPRRSEWPSGIWTTTAARA